jgi:hypothetical protein
VTVYRVRSEVAYCYSVAATASGVMT